MLQENSIHDLVLQMQLIKLVFTQTIKVVKLVWINADLGFLLFYRSRSGIQLTPSGKLFLVKAQKAQQALNELDLENNNETLFGGRTISIGCHPTVAQYCLPKALSRLKSLAPDYKVEIRHDLSRNIQAEIQRGNIDIGIVINPAEVPDLVIQKLAVDHIYVWSSPSDKDHDTIIYNQNLFQTQSILKKWTKKPQKIINTDSLELITRLVNEGIGYGIIPERAVLLSDFKLKKINSLPIYKDQICLLN